MENLVDVDRLRKRLALAEAVVEAAERCVETAGELRRYLSPDKGCGYVIYCKTWDASRVAEIAYLAALAAYREAEEG